MKENTNKFHLGGVLRLVTESLNKAGFGGVLYA